MTNTYFSTFIPGTGEIIQKLLPESIPVDKISMILDGLIVYESSSDVAAIQRLPFFNNSFLVLKSFFDLQENAIGEMMKKSWKDKRLEERIPRKIQQRQKTFRIIASQENQTVTMDTNLLRNWERKIEKLLCFTINRSKPDIEFWFLYRREGYGFFAMRLTTHTAYEKILEKGELRPELSYLLAYLAQPNPEDILLDPFCGSGAIPMALTHFEHRKIIASDNSQEKIAKFQKKAHQEKKELEIQCLDALQLDRVYKKQVHKIITDPPWGLFAMPNTDLGEFYTQMLQSFLSVLQENFTMVLLIGQKEVFEKTLEKFSHNLKLLKKYNILVSGKKAAIYLLMNKN